MRFNSFLTAARSVSVQVCIVTGGNAGIGLGTASALAARGAHVILACRSAERGKEAAQVIIALSSFPEPLLLSFLHPILDRPALLHSQPMLSWSCWPFLQSPTTLVALLGAFTIIGQRPVTALAQAVAGVINHVSSFDSTQRIEVVWVSEDCSTVAQLRLQP